MNLKQLAEWIQWSHMLDGDEAPTREWCERIAKKHAKKAKDKKPKRHEFKHELFDSVRKDKDEDGKHEGNQ